MSTRRRFATAIIAATTAASLASTPAMAAEADEPNASTQLAAWSGLATGSLLLPINSALVEQGSYTNEQAAASTVLGGTIVAFVVPIAATIAIGVGLYNYAQSQGWVQ